LASFIVATTVIGAACSPLPTPEQEARERAMRIDSLIAVTARDSSPAWRADHFPAANLHGPFPRPKLPAGADTNDAGAYYKLGANVAWRLAGVADRAFYWATRLDPTMADAYYARWDVRRHGLQDRLYADDSVRPADKLSPNEGPALDSLRTTAVMYDPFLDGAIYIPPQIRVMSEEMADRDPALAGLRAYARGNYAKAVRKFDEAIRSKPQNARLHVPRAFAWLRLKGGRDSAVADLTALINRLERIEDSTVSAYVSKDYLYYAIGFLRTGQSRYPEARTAYEGALTENLGFYMAHVRLSAIDFALQDTTAALTELQTASLIRGDDPILLAFLGQVLLSQGKLKEAEGPLKAAVHADTDFALPYSFLGELAEQKHDTASALAGYREYLARASRSAPERNWVDAHVAYLTSHGPSK
jgi:tetratricopeptide (TPR) repeat protein